MKTTMKKHFLLFLTLFMTLLIAMSLVACGDSKSDNTGKYKLSYTKGAYAAQGEVPETKYYDAGEEITLAPANTFTFSGYTFSGWNDGTDNYDGGATFVMPEHDVNLAAKWIIGDPDAGSISSSEVGFDGEYFVFKGTVKNVKNLYVYLNNTNVSTSNDNYVKAEITGNTFVAKLPLSTLIGYNRTNTPFNLRYKIDNLSSELLGVAQGNLNLSATHKFNEYAFRLAVNSGSGCVAVYYSPAPDTTVTVTATQISFDGEYFAVTGTAENVTQLYIYLTNTNVSGSENNFVKAEFSGKTFNARLPLSALIEYDVGSNIPFNLRYRANDSKVNINITKGSLDITQTHTYGGKVFRLGLNGECVAVYYTAAPVEPEPGEPDYTFQVDSMHFTDGKFIIEGTCGADVEKLVFHLHNTQAPVINFTSAAVINGGGYKVEFVLSEIKREDGSAPPTTYINVRYELNDDGYNSLNLLPVTNGNYQVGQAYRYGDKTWTLKADENRTYLNWSEVTDKYRISEVNLELVEGKPTLTISGNTVEAIEAGELKLLLDKNLGAEEEKEKKYIENTATEAGKFRFTVDLSDLLASPNETAANKQQAYFIRLYNGSTQLSNINSSWASDLLWERGQIETETAVYFLMKNTEWSNTAWNTLGICKFDK